jgi:hypothetical protein
MLEGSNPGGDTGTGAGAEVLGGAMPGGYMLAGSGEAGGDGGKGLTECGLVGGGAEA